MMIVVAAFYKFVRLDDLTELQESIRSICAEQGLCGTILLAEEGINGTIAGSRSGIDAVLGDLRSDPRLIDLEHKESLAECPPFDRLKVRLKQEIVPLGVPTVNPADRAGVYVEPQQWNQLISDPNVLVLDTRNDYEVAIGTFQGAENPQTQAFRQFPEYAQQLDPDRHPKIAMFCTGGIRCEKASAYLLSQGFPEVYHLKGGILKYLEEVPAAESLWQGECFVFDQRVAVTHGLEIGSYDACRACGRPIAESDKALPGYEAGICCAACCDSLTEAQKAGHRERQRQLELDRQRRAQKPRDPM